MFRLQIKRLIRPPGRLVAHDPKSSTVEGAHVQSGVHLERSLRGLLTSGRM